MDGYNIADYGYDTVEEVTNSVGKSLFKRVVLEWSKPQAINANKPFFEDNRPLLYIILRNHHSMKQKDRIRYIGLSANPKNRFQNHPKATELADMRGETSLSYAFLDQGKSSSRIESIKSALEEIEHIMIWSLWFELLNDKKMYTLPGMGKNSGTAWHIINSGYRFRGQMPREIVYPWILKRHGRDRSFTTRVLSSDPPEPDAALE
ncbi:hypothetical protein ELG88_29410 (plasmid) [Rhizobium leguminosarum]|jgi:hypothetical protein|uniref:hypothetical protein n=1 Tax=Rhizobium leguminosarum TaxID=384 RepID=UPI0010316967|nr:hypothetical protein [Rhizobium leguminosarum]TBF26479.1 hypothetical protein ELG88_29410 [Rhizobium leguminosarum]